MWSVTRPPVWILLAVVPSSGCTPVCTGATCADSFNLADLRGVVDSAGEFGPADASGHIAGQPGDGRLRSFARAGTDALLVGIPDGSRVQIYTGAFYLGTEDAELAGEPGEGFGAAVSTATQLVVGAPHAGAGPLLPSIGRVYVFPYDRPSALASLADATQVVDGGAAADGLGSTVAACGDIDGDGLADVLAGAPDALDLGGRVVLIAGGTGSGSASDRTGWEGDAAGAWLGAAIGCGDFDGDGLDDAVIGAPYAAGRAGPGVGAVLIESVHGQLFRLEGGQENAYFGASIAVGDVDADGVPDLIVGATGRPSADAAADDLRGAVHVFNGGRLRAVGSGQLGGLGLGEDSRVLGIDARGRAGDVVGTGDVDGDGVGDVLIGAPGTNTGAAATGAQTGALYVVSGPFGQGLHPVQREERDVTDASLVIRGTRVYERVGEAAALVDLDQTGAADVVFTTREEE